MNNDQMIPFVGLWKNKSRRGVEYLSGTLGGAKLLVFRNTRKEKESHPDFLVYVAPKPQRDDDHRDRERQLNDPNDDAFPTSDETPF